MNKAPVPADKTASGCSVREWKKILPFLLALCAVFNGASQLFRMLWFDEVLTVNLLLKLPFGRIYSAYEIPNNHIVFTLLEKLWTSISSTLFPLAYFHFRIPVLVSGGIAIFLLSRSLYRKYKLFPATLLCGAFVCSSVWAAYTTAVRGYMTSFLLTVLALLIMEHWLKSRKFLPGSLLYGLISLLAVGTVPSNLAALAGVSLYYLPHAYRSKKWKVWISSCLLPLLALAVFYLPILDKFLGCIRLGEGWFSRTHAVYAFYTGTLFPVMGLLPFIAAGTLLALCRYKKHAYMQIFCDLLIFLVPLAAFLVMKVPPFPRVFFPLLAVWLCAGTRILSVYFQNGKIQKTFLLYLPLIFQAGCCLYFFQGGSVRAGNFLYGSDGRADDYIAPYYARIDFEPNKVIRFLQDKVDQGETFHVFATFDSDAPSLLFAAQLGRLPEGILKADTLNGPKIEKLPLQEGHLYIIAANEQDLKTAMQRFGLKRSVPVKQFGLQKIYMVFP